MRAFSPGDLVVRRDIHRGRIKYAAAFEAVGYGDEGRELLAAIVPGGDVASIAGGVSTGDRVDRDAVARTFAADASWQLQMHGWEHTVALHRILDDRWFNLVHFFTPDTSTFQCWYVNFERPVRWNDRLPGYDTLDLLLDIVVTPDGTARLKDTDHWAWAVDARVYEDEDVAEVEALRAALVEDARAGRPPFDGVLTDWTPPHALAPRRLPPGWDTLT